VKVAFAADGKSLLSGAEDGTVRSWPLSPRGDERHRVLTSTTNGANVSADPAGKYALVAGAFESRVHLVPLQNGEPREMPGLRQDEAVTALAFSVDGRLVAAAGRRPTPLRVWNLESGAIRALDPSVGYPNCEWGGGLETIRDLEFLPDGRLLTGGTSGVRVWDLESGRSQEIRPCAEKSWRRLAVSRDGRILLVTESNPDTRVSTLGVHDLAAGSYKDIASHGNRLAVVALDPTGTIAVTGDLDGVVRVGPITGEEPHLLFGHEHQVSSVAVSPDSRWIASASQDGTIRLWPMPEGTPLHALPYEEILERLRSLTNLRVVADEGSDTDYRMKIGPFPGWKALLEW
jgi:WD40 repeat protein